MSDTWDAVRRAFEKATDLSGAERLTYLEQLRTDDPALAAEVASLLEADNDSHELLGGLSDRIASLEDSLETTAPPLPDSIGGFPVKGTLGRGGMGVVYQAVDPKLDRPVAIKMLPARYRHDPASVAQLHREAKLIAALNHPAIASLHSLEATRDGDSFLVMEFVPGESLRQRLTRGPLPADAALRLGLHLTGALQAAHELGIVHLDLKPDNVMLTPRDQVKVLDFGIAKNVGLRHEAETSGERIGTPGYMSPEQIRGETVDPRSDLFGLGSLLFECLTGEPAFPGDTIETRLAKTLDGSPDWDRVNATEALKDLISQCLQRDPANRPPGAVAVASMFTRLLGDTETPMTALQEKHHNLPRERTPFIGRVADLHQLATLLDEHRLLTLIGPGGSGKTRLALRAARQRLRRTPGDAWLVDLSPIEGPDRVLHLLADSVPDLVAPEGGGPAIPDIVARLKDRRLTLVLDNCEHVVAAVRDVAAALLEDCPRVNIVATSREPLGLPEEHAFPVTTLSLPDAARVGAAEALRAANASDGVRLFVDRAVRHRADFELTETNAPQVVEICRRIDGIPLAIELAAARVRLLSPHQILELLEDRFRLLTGGPGEDARQKTLRDAIRWSYELLTETESRLFCTLSVFAGGWTLEAAVAVTRQDEFALLDGMTSLANKSLIEVGLGKDDQPRFRFLETTRQFALELLNQSTESTTIRGRHLHHFHALAVEAQAGLNGPEFLSWSKRLEAEHDNLLAAMQAPAADDAAADLLLATGAAMMSFWRVRGYMGQARVAMESVVARARVRTLNRTRALRSLAGIFHGQGDYEAAGPLMTEALAIAEAAGDELEQAAVIHGMSILAAETGNLARARKLSEQCLPLFQNQGDDRGAGSTLLSLGLLASLEGKPEEAVPYLEEAAAILRRIGNLSTLANVLGNLADLQMTVGHETEAFQHLKEGLVHSRTLTLLGDGAHLLLVASSWAAKRNQVETAARFLGAAEGIWESSGAKPDPREQSLRDDVVEQLDAVSDAAARRRFDALRSEACGETFEDSVDAALAWARGIHA